MTGTTAELKCKIPDATMGLATYLRRASGLNNPEAHESLFRDGLDKQLRLRECGLVVDPKWGKTDLIFPWAVYEAKKENCNYFGKNGRRKFSKEADLQLNDAYRMYLGMLDDLMRNPADPEKYQKNCESRYVQMFGFASSGTYWAVNVAFYKPGTEVVRFNASPQWERCY